MAEKKSKKKKVVIIIACVIFAAVAFFFADGIFCNNVIQVTNYRIETSFSNFSGFKIVQISDLHNTYFGKDSERLIKKVSDAKPDIIAITGDYIDSTDTDIDMALNLAKELVKIAPCYFITGNHEYGSWQTWSSLRSPSFLEELADAGVHVLRNEAEILDIGGVLIQLIGVDDPTYKLASDPYGEASELIKSNIEKLKDDSADFTVVLSHRAELFEAYVSCGVDLVLAGHAHGGQIRLPFVGGIWAPNQGLFPKYDAGLYAEQNTKMIVSRGLGNSKFPFRINNCAELVVVDVVGR